MTTCDLRWAWDKSNGAKGAEQKGNLENKNLKTREREKKRKEVHEEGTKGSEYTRANVHENQGRRETRSQPTQSARPKEHVHVHMSADGHLVLQPPWFHRDLLVSSLTL